MQNDSIQTNPSSLTIIAPPPSSPNPSTYLTLYCFIFFVFGLEGGSIGPAIPYLSKQRNKQETQYSFLFTARTVGSIVAFFFMKVTEKRQWRDAEHKIIIAGLSIVNAGFLAGFVLWSSWVGQFTSLAVFGGGHYGVLAISNICVLTIGQKKAGVWVILVNALFGVGALTAPQIIRFWGLESYYLYAILYLIVAVLCLIFGTPMQHHSKVDSSDSSIKTDESLPASRKLQILVGIGLFLIAGIEMTVSGWIPSYAVMVKILNRKEATVYGTLFWSVSTIFRFLAAAVTVKNSVKLKFLLLCVFLCSGTCFILNYLSYFGAAALVGSLCYGMACSAVFPLLVSISLQYGIQFRNEQISNMMIAPVLSSMCIAGVTGTLMHEDVNMLFWSLLAMSFLLVVDAVVLFKQMEGIRSGAEVRLQVSPKDQIQRLTQA